MRILTIIPFYKTTHCIKNEKGSAIVIVLLILIAVTVIGVTSSNVSITELFITGNDVVKKISLLNADAGTFAVPKVISQAINDKATPTTPPVPAPPATPSFGIFDYADAGSDITDGDRTFYRELAGFIGPDVPAADDISFQNDGVNSTGVNVERIGSFSLVGGGAEFASGAEGHGISLKGIRFNLTSTGTGQKNAVTVIGSRYLKVLGTAGGL